MPLSTDVTLPKAHTAVFADRCVVCAAPSPAHHVRLLTSSVGWWTWLTWMFGTPFSLKAPACRGCGWRLHLSRFAGLIVTICLTFAALTLVWPMIEDLVPRAGRKWWMMGTAMVCLSPYLIWSVFFPPAFDVTAHDLSVDYEFRDEKLALEFAGLNLDAEYVKIDGCKIEKGPLDEANRLLRENAHLLADPSGDDA